MSTRIDTCLAFTTADLHELLLGFTTSIFKLDTKIIEYHDAPEDLDGPLPHGRPYALAENGEKFYADMIVAADGKESLARTHVLASAGEDDPAEIDTKWNVTIGSLLAGELQKGHDKAGVEELFKSDSVDVWVGDEAYVSSITVGGKAGQEQEFLFTKYDLNADNKDGDLQAPGQPLVEGWDPRLAAAVRSAELLSEGIRINIRQKPSTLVSRKSRKLLLFGESGFTFPPHSPHLDLSYHVEAAATLAVCMRKAASVPLGLEIYTRLRAPRFKETMELAMERFNTITKSATGGELEANEVLWEIEVGEDGWWEHDAEKWAEKNFEGIIDELTAELLGRHKAMLEAQEKAAAEEKARLEEESRKAQYEDGESSSSESDGESSSSESDAGVKLDQEQSKVLEDGDNEKDVS